MEKVLDLKMPGVQELGLEELRKVDGGIWWLIPVGWVVTEILMNPNTTAETYNAAATDELEKIRNEY